MSKIYHNVRDKYGRFTSADKPKKAAKKRAPKAKKSLGIFNIFLLDDSASMASKVVETVNGFNQVLEDAKKANFDNDITGYEALARFAQARKYAWKFGSILPLSKFGGENVYNPNGDSTALWDAIIKGIDDTDRVLQGLPKDTKVIFSVFTDGLNNELYELHETAKKMIAEKQASGWVINFIGAGSERDVKAVATSVGIFASNTLNYTNDQVGTRQAFRKMSDSRVSYSSKLAAGVATQDGFFSDEK